MKRDMKQWVAEAIAAPVKKPMPVLSFPAVQLMGITVRDLISSSEHQAQGMELVAKRVDSAAAVSLMDLPQAAQEFAFWSMMVFLGVLTVGFIYEWKKGALEWE